MLERSNRGTIHQILIESGSEAALQMAFTDVQNSPAYRTKARMLSEGFDVPARDPESGDAFVFEVIRVLARRDAPAIATPEAGLAGFLQADGISLADVLGHATPPASPEIQAYLDAGDLRSAAELHRKQWSRVETDPSGAITAATSCLEAVLRAALDELGIDRAGANQLPDLLGRLVEGSNFDQLLPHGEMGARFMRSIRGFASNAYSLAHEAGDRHGGDPASPMTDRETAYTFVSSTELVLGVITRGLTSRRLRATSE